MYPLLLKAPVKDYIWGGNRLIEDFNFESETETAAEAWVLSCHKDGENIVRNGDYSGKTLSEVLSIWGKKALGSKAAAFPHFPILIKLIDARDRLPLQVHPDDDYALFYEQEYGKTVMWYVLDCGEDAQLIYGLNKKINRNEFEEHIKNNTILDVCNFVPVKKGDVFFIEAGTLHAIGKGILIAQLQQNSNATYLVSDYGRLGADGKPCKLHISQAVEVTNTAPSKHPYGAVGDVMLYPFGTVRELASCDYFHTELIHMDGNMGLYDNESFISLIVLEGDVTVSYPSSTSHLKKGDSLFLPAGLKIKISGKADILHTHL